MKKILLLLLFVFLSTNVVSACEEGNTNPIDEVFANYYDKATTTISLKYVVAKELDAWQGELKNVSGLLKAQYKFDKDKKLVDDYLITCDKLADNVSAIKFLEWADINTPPGSDRTFGTGATMAMAQAQIQVYKEATKTLIASYQEISGKKYDYIFVDTVKNLFEKEDLL